MGKTCFHGARELDHNPGIANLVILVMLLLVLPTIEKANLLWIKNSPAWSRRQPSYSRCLLYSVSELFSLMLIQTYIISLCKNTEG